MSTWFGASHVALMVKKKKKKKLPANAGNLRDAVLIPESGRSPRGGHGKLLQYSCLKNPMDRGAWQATVHGVTQSQTPPSNLAQRDTVLTIHTSFLEIAHIRRLLSVGVLDTSCTLWSSDSTLSISGCFHWLYLWMFPLWICWITFVNISYLWSV